MRKRLKAVRSKYVHDIPSYKFPGSSSNTDLVSILSCDLFNDLHVASVAASSQAFICLTQPAGAGSGFKSHARVLMVNFHSTSFTLTPVDALEGVQTLHSLQQPLTNYVKKLSTNSFYCMYPLKLSFVVQAKT